MFRAKCPSCRMPIRLSSNEKWKGDLKFHICKNCGTTLERTRFSYWIQFVVYYIVIQTVYALGIKFSTKVMIVVLLAILFTLSFHLFFRYRIHQSLPVDAKKPKASPKLKEPVVEKPEPIVAKKTTIEPEMKEVVMDVKKAKKVSLLKEPVVEKLEPIASKITESEIKDAEIVTKAAEEKKPSFQPVQSPLLKRKLMQSPSPKDRFAARQAAMKKNGFSQSLKNSKSPESPLPPRGSVSSLKQPENIVGVDSIASKQNRKR